MKVIATRVGYYEHRRRKANEVFELIEINGLKDGKPKKFSPEEQFSQKWMEKYDAAKAAKPKAGSRKPSNTHDNDSDVI